MICLIANGRSGTNALYYNLFKLPNEFKTKEPWKCNKLNDTKRFINKKKMCENLTMFHIKPKQHTDLPPKELIDLFIKKGIKNFIILKRTNVLALLVSDFMLKKKYNKEKKCTIAHNYFKWCMHKFLKYEDECVNYLSELSKSNDAIKYIELIYEDDIKDDVQVACNKVKNAFSDIPDSKYIKNPPKQSNLPNHAKHNALRDKRTLSEKIQNIDEVKKYLGDKHKWMLE